MTFPSSENNKTAAFDLSKIMWQFVCDKNISIDGKDYGTRVHVCLLSNKKKLHSIW